MYNGWRKAAASDSVAYPGGPLKESMLGEMVDEMF